MQNRVISFEKACTGFNIRIINRRVTHGEKAALLRLLD